MRNTARFLLGNLHDFEPGRDSLAVTDMVDLDRTVRIVRAFREILLELARA